MCLIKSNHSDHFLPWNLQSYREKYLGKTARGWSDNKWLSVTGSSIHGSLDMKILGCEYERVAQQFWSTCSYDQEKVCDQTAWLWNWPWLASGQRTDETDRREHRSPFAPHTIVHGQGNQTEGAGLGHRDSLGRPRDIWPRRQQPEGRPGAQLSGVGQC